MKFHSVGFTNLQKVILTVLLNRITELWTTLKPLAMKNLYQKSVSLFILTIFFSASLLANGLFFSVKVNRVLTDNTEKLSDYKIVKSTKDYVVAGEYLQYIEAMKAKQEIGKQGFKSIEIIALFNHAIISLSEAFALQDNRIDQDIKNKGFLLSENEMDGLLASVQNQKFFYTVQMGLFSEKNVNSFFDFPKQYDESITSKGNLRYTFGRFTTYNDAKDALLMVKEYGLNDAFVIAFDKLERIPIDRALVIENQEMKEVLLAVE